MKSGYERNRFCQANHSKVFKEWHTVPSYQRHYVWESDDVNDIE